MDTEPSFEGWGGFGGCVADCLGSQKQLSPATQSSLPCLLIPHVECDLLVSDSGMR